MIQSVGFRGLHVKQEDNKYLNNLSRNIEARAALQKACAKINKASGDTDVYLKTTVIENTPGYCILSVEDEDGKTIHQELFNERLPYAKDQIASLANMFVAKFSSDIRDSKAASDKAGTIDDIFDTYV